MASYGNTIITKDLICEDVHSSGTISWTAFDPPLNVSGLETLASVLTTGNDANNQDIKNVNSIEATAATIGTVNYTTLNPPIPGAEGLADTLTVSNSAGSNSIDMNSNNITNVNSLTATSATIGTVNYTTLNPPVPGTEGLADTLTVSNSAGSNSIDMNNNNITNGSTISGVTIQGRNADLNSTSGTTATLKFTGTATNTQPDTFIEGDTTNKTKCSHLDLSDPSNAFPVTSPSGLADVLSASNSAGSNNIDMNNNNITTVQILSAVGVQASAAVNASAVSATSVSSAPTFQGQTLNLNSTSGKTATLDFTSTAGNSQPDTFIEGDTTNRTKCKYLDLSDPSNTFPVNDRELYNWGGSWDTDNPDSAGILIYADTDEITGWRYFQETDDDGNYVAGSNPFWVETTPTSISAHSTQMITVSANITGKGYGRIYMGLFYSSDGGTTKQLYPGTYRVWTPKVVGGGLQAANVRMVGCRQMVFVVYNFPTDGKTYRIYPVIRTEDGESGDDGEVEIRIGGLPEDAPTATIDPQYCMCIIHGEPVPTTWKTVTGNPPA